MIFSWLRRRRRRKLLAQPFPADWLPLLEGLPFYSQLDADGQARLRDITRVLVAGKSWEGCGGLRATVEMKVVIAAQAGLLVLRRARDDYPNVRSILIYPSAYRTQDQMDAAGVVRSGQANLGEAWSRGPVILSWDAVVRGVQNGRDGRNLVFHEFAHKLDLLDGLADGTPPLDSSGQHAAWVATMTAEFGRLREASAEGRATVLDTYGATNPAEFFAVATECFFEKSAALRRHHPELYSLLREYYGQTPATGAD